MSEESLIRHWNHLRQNFIVAQIAPTLLLGAMITLAVLGNLENISNPTKYFAIVVLSSSGLLTFINQYASIREGQSVARELAKLSQESALVRQISSSSFLLIYTAVLISLLSIATFGCFLWVLFSN